MLMPVHQHLAVFRLKLKLSCSLLLLRQFLLALTGNTTMRNMPVPGKDSAQDKVYSLLQLLYNRPN